MEAYDSGKDQIMNFLEFYYEATKMIFFRFGATFFPRLFNPRFLAFHVTFGLFIEYHHLSNLVRNNLEARQRFAFEQR